MRRSLLKKQSLQLQCTKGFFSFYASCCPARLWRDDKGSPHELSSRSLSGTEHAPHAGERERERERDFRTPDIVDQENRRFYQSRLIRPAVCSEPKAFQIAAKGKRSAG